MNLDISVERKGQAQIAGTISGYGIEDARFRYEARYLERMDAVPISISLPLQREAFSPEQTRNFFDGLLPEGFTRRTVADWIHTDESNYLEILSSLGKECLGAIKVSDSDNSSEIPCGYEKLSMEQVHELAREGASKSTELVTRAHLSLTGASGKVGLYYDKADRQWYLPVGSAPSTHIVKQSHIRLNAIVTNEQLSIFTAKKLGIDAPETFIINTGNFEDGDVLFATERYDRLFEKNAHLTAGLPVPLRLHQEDFGQALGIPASEKYEKPGYHYLREMVKLLRSYSADPIQDITKLWNIVIFNFLLGNTDAHVKNFSLLYGEDLKTIRLAPAYDLVSTSTYKESTRDMAFNIGGKVLIDEIQRSSFMEAAEEAGINITFAMKQFDRMAEGFERALHQSVFELAEMGYENAKQIGERILQTGGIHNLK